MEFMRTWHGSNGAVSARRLHDLQLHEGRITADRMWCGDLFPAAQLTEPAAARTAGMAPSKVRRREVARSVAELVGDGSRSMMTPADSKSGARFEWVLIDGERLVPKHQDVADDWLMRATGDLGRRYVALWEYGVLDRVPDVIDHATVGCAYDGRAGAVLLRDVSAGLLPPGDGLIAIESHRRFLDHMAVSRRS